MHDHLRPRILTVSVSSILALVLAVINPASSSSHSNSSMSKVGVVIFSSLGAASPDTQFNAGGSGGTSILDFQFVGPEFTLTETTTLIEIGAFVNTNLTRHIALSDSQPFLVQIRPAVNGLPDAAHVLASYTLSDDGTPLIVSYESVSIELTLEPGSYYALFAPRGTEQGYLLGQASDPFDYLAGSVNLGDLDPANGSASASLQYGAVRILGEPFKIYLPLVAKQSITLAKIGDLPAVANI
jgi:hypothetical protein